jgi:hypothetical protein
MRRAGAGFEIEGPAVAAGIGAESEIAVLGQLAHESCVPIKLAKLLSRRRMAGLDLGAFAMSRQRLEWFAQARPTQEK